MRRRTLLASVGAGVAAGASGCLSTLGVTDDEGPCSGADCEIGMSRMEYLPATYEVSVGDTVVWRNTSSAEHTVTAYENGIPDDAEYFASGGFESEQGAREAWADDLSGAIGVRETYEHTFRVPGTYRYFCIPHERAGMVGEIVVSG